MLGDRLKQRVGIAVHAGPPGDDTGAAARSEDLPLRGVEAHRRLLQDDRRRAELVGGPQPSHLADDAAVLDHHTLRLARAARGVDDVGEVARSRTGVELDLHAEVSGALRVLEADDREVARGQRGEAASERLLAEDDLGAAVLDHVPQPVLGVLRREREVRTAGAQDPPDADHELERALDEQADAVVGADAEVAQVRGNAGAGPTELAIGQLLASEDDRDVIGLPANLLAQEVGKGALGARRGSGVRRAHDGDVTVLAVGAEPVRGSGDRRPDQLERRSGALRTRMALRRYRVSASRVHLQLLWGLGVGGGGGLIGVKTVERGWANTTVEAYRGAPDTLRDDAHASLRDEAHAPAGAPCTGPRGSAKVASTT